MSEEKNLTPSEEQALLPEEATPPPALPEPPPIKIIAPNDSVRSERQNGCLWGLAGAGGCLLLLAAIVIIPIVLGIGTLSNTANAVLSIFSPQTPVARVTSTQTLVNTIQPLGQLVSISAQLAKADINVSVQQGALNSCGYSASHVAEGTIEAGIDLAQFDEEAIRYNTLTDTFTIHLPAPQLSSCRIDFIRQYSRSFTTCAVDWDEARILASYLSLVDFRDDALEGGILQRAEQEGSLIIGNFVSALTDSQVQIIFDEAESPIIPASCQPEVPQNWTFVESMQQWVKG